MVKTKHNTVRRRSAPLDAKLGKLIETNISNSRARFRCVSHSRRADTARIVKFRANFIDALRRDVRVGLLRRDAADERMMEKCGGEISRLLRERG